MCSELFRIPYEWGGVPIFGVGILLAGWIVVALVTTVRVLRSGGSLVDLFGFLPLFAIGVAALLVLPQLFPGGLPIRGYGLMVVLGAGLGLAMACQRGAQIGLDSERIVSLAFWLFVSGIVGARLFYVIEYWETDFRGDSWSATLGKALDFPQGGLVIYGAFLGAMPAFVVFVRRHGLPLLAFADLIAPSLLVGLACGRIGCLLNGCCFGVLWISRGQSRFLPRVCPTTIRQPMAVLLGSAWRPGRLDRPPSLLLSQVPRPTRLASRWPQVTSIDGEPLTTFAEAAQRIAEASLSGRPLRFATAEGQTIAIPAVPVPARSRPVHPTQVYSAINAGLIAWLLWVFYPFRRRDGQVVALLLTIYPVNRFLLEMIRIDEAAVFGTGLSISQNISVGMFLLAIGLWIALARRPGEKISRFYSQEAAGLG